MKLISFLTDFIIYNFNFTEMLFLSLMLIQNEIKLKFIFISAFPSSLLQDDT